MGSVHLYSSHPSMSLDTVHLQSYKNLAKYQATEAVTPCQFENRSLVASVGGHYLGHPWTPKCKGAPQGSLVGPWEVVPIHFEYESTLIHVRNPSTNFHHF